MKHMVMIDAIEMAQLAKEGIQEAEEQITLAAKETPTKDIELRNIKQPTSKGCKLGSSMRKSFYDGRHHSGAHRIANQLNLFAASRFGKPVFWRKSHCCRELSWL